MNRTNLCDISPGDALWFQNLQLLGMFYNFSSFEDSFYPGFAHHNPAFPFCQSMFDHANPVAFQQVFHYLFSLLSVEKTMSEFRDCWPILDRKQEAEFRRKVITILKEYQREFPMDLPYSNPSLFQSPGGRKFTSFLLAFSNFVLKVLLDPEFVLSKPVLKNNSKLRKVCYKSLVENTTQALNMSAKLQAEQENVVLGAESAINEIGQNYCRIKQYIDDAKSIDENEVKLEHVKIFNNNNNKIDEIGPDVLKYYDGNCAKMNSLKQNLEVLFYQHNNIWKSIAEVVDSDAIKPKLNFDLLPTHLIAVDDMKMTYQNMIAHVLTIGDKVLPFKTGYGGCPHVNVSNMYLKLIFKGAV